MRRHGIGSISHAAKRPIDRVFAHRLKRRTEFRKNIAPATAQRFGFAQNRKRLLRERNAVRLALFHSLGWNRPDCAVEVYFAPFGLADFAGALENQGGEPQRQRSNWLPALFVD